MQIAMVLWSYFAAVVTDPGGVPQGWTPFADEEVILLHGAKLCLDHILQTITP